MVDKIKVTIVVVMVCTIFSFMLSSMSFARSDNNGTDQNQLVIDRVEIDYKNESMTIFGDNFDNGGSPKIIFCGNNFDRVTSGATTISVDLTQTGFSLNGYQGVDCTLSVATGSNDKNYDEFDVTVGADSPAGKPVTPRGLRVVSTPKD